MKLIFDRLPEELQPRANIEGLTLSPTLNGLIDKLWRAATFSGPLWVVDDDSATTTTLLDELQLKSLDPGRLVLFHQYLHITSADPAMSELLDYILKNEDAFRKYRSPQIPPSNDQRKASEPASWKK